MGSYAQSKSICISKVSIESVQIVGKGELFGEKEKDTNWC